MVLGLFKDYVVIPVLIFPALRFQGWNAVRKSSTLLRWSVLSAWWDWKISLSSFYFVPFLSHIIAVSREKPSYGRWIDHQLAFSRLQAFIKSLSSKEIPPLCHFPSLIPWSANYMSTYSIFSIFPSVQNKLHFFIYSEQVTHTNLWEKRPKHNTKKRTRWHVCKYPVFQCTLFLHLLVHTQHYVLQGCS